MTKEEEIIEIMAEVEHIRWASWQKHLHSKCVDVKGPDIVIPREWFDRWQRQIETSYKDLSESEKESDRREARKTLKALEKEGFEII